MKKFEYIGCFFEPNMLQQLPVNGKQGRLYRRISTPHVTFAYAPQEVPGSLFGVKVTVKVIGYGCNGVNEALQVEFAELPAALAPLAAEVSVPHITLSVAEEGKPVNSRFLEFAPIEQYYLEGVFGGMDMDGTLHLKPCY